MQRKMLVSSQNKQLLNSRQHQADHLHTIGTESDQEYYLVARLRKLVLQTTLLQAQSLFAVDRKVILNTN